MFGFGSKKDVASRAPETAPAPALRNEVPVSPGAPYSRLIRPSVSATDVASQASGAVATTLVRPSALVRNAVPLPSDAPVSRPLPGRRPGW